MAEPESLAQDEGLDTHIRRHAFDRLLMISDGIFAIAITLAALEIKLPEDVPTDLVEMLGVMARPVLTYLISFLMIAIFWLHHRDLFARIRRVDGVLTVLTLALLCLISLLPAMVHGLQEHGETTAAPRLYAITMIVCGVISLAMWAYAALKPGILRPEVPRAYRILRTMVAILLPLLFVPVLFMHANELMWIMVAFGIVAGGFRRFILPRWLKATG